MAYRYVKAPPGYTLARPTSGKKIFKQIVSSIFLTLGIAATTSVIYPMIYYQANFAPRLEATNMVSPTVANVQSTLAVKAAETSTPTFMPEMINTTLDYTDPDTWFPEAKRAEAQYDSNETYSLSIPELGINGATVVTTHSDLKKSLIQYPGTALPGDLGNTVIFGHSVLPQFFNPKNYLTIFSTLHTLKKGDDIVITYDNVEYKYRISDMYQVMPDNLAPLAQSYDGHRLTLITCTPPGTYLRRLIVKADLI